MNNNISLCIITDNLDERLKQTVAACSAHFREILIGYNGTADLSPDCMEGYKPARLIQQEWEGYSMTKNKLAEKASNDWICSLDADERPDTLLFEEIGRINIQDADGRNVYAFSRLSFFEGRPMQHGAWGRDTVIRLYNKRKVQWGQDPVHEQLGPYTSDRLIRLRGKLYHYTADNAATFTKKNRHYALLSAGKYFIRGKKSPLYKRWLSPLFTFIKEYLFQLGFLDGIAGFKIAWINARYTYWKYHFLHQKINAPEG